MNTLTIPSQQEVWQFCTSALYADLKREADFDAVRPFLAHYTTLDVLEKILRTNEVWFSNPLLMNDPEEVRFGVLNGADRVRANEAIAAALQTDDRRRLFQEAYQHIFQTFADQHSLDTYVLSFCRHDDPRDPDGMLSMWGRYGDNGRGAAIVFDTSKLGPALQGSHALILAAVHYASAAERIAWIDRKLDDFAAVLTAGHVPDDMLYIAAAALFSRLKLFALFTKHRGFSEEREWRAVYQRENDPENRLGATFGHYNGPRGIEPKLKFEVKPVAGMTVDDFSLETLVSSILLGPAASSPLSVATVRRSRSVPNKPRHR